MDELRARVTELIEREQRELFDRTAQSRAAHQQALAVMPMGLPATGQFFDPQLVASEAHGALLLDVDGNEYIDCNMGYGALLVGHGHPVVLDAVRAQLERGTVHLLPSLANTVVAEALRDRWGLPLWRFTNSGTEATMPALRAARSFTGRDRVVKVEGSYHGQYDTMLASLKPTLAEAGPADKPNTVPASTGIPAAYLSQTTVVQFNDLGAIERELAAHDVACVVLEPALQNIGIVLPDAGYLQGLRERCDATGTLLVFDEVKIGITAHWGGATSLYGVTPDLVAISKSIGGGLPLGAVGGRADVLGELRAGRATHVGTFSGNPLSMAAASATLLDVCTPEATHATIVRSQTLADGIGRAIAAHGLPGHVVHMGAKGCVTWRSEPVRTYRDTLEVDRTLGRALWLWCANRGVLLPPGLDGQWLLSVQHSDAHVATIIDVVAAWCASLAS